MATDQSPPRNRVILWVTIFTVLALVALKFVFDSYFLKSMEREVAYKVLESPTAEKEEMLKEQHELLKNGTVAIDQAVEMIARKGRGSFEVIQPSASSDKAAKQGWNDPKPPDAK